MIATETRSRKKVLPSGLNHMGHTVKEMNDKTYKLRRRVMGFIYEAKALVPNLPRVTIRITSTDDNTTGGCLAFMGCDSIFISEECVPYKDDLLRQIVFHEIAHAVFGTEHVTGCPLMHPYYRVYTCRKDVIDKLFVKYSQKRWRKYNKSKKRFEYKK